MALSKVWVHVEVNEGAVAPITLEILAKARELADTVEAFAGGDAERRRRGCSAPTAPPRCSPPATWAASFQGAHVAAALAALVEAEGAPDADHVRHHLRRPRHRRPACR